MQSKDRNGTTQLSINLIDILGESVDNLSTWSSLEEVSELGVHNSEHHLGVNSSTGSGNCGESVKTSETVQKISTHQTGKDHVKEEVFVFVVLDVGVGPLKDQPLGTVITQVSHTGQTSEEEDTRNTTEYLEGSKESSKANVTNLSVLIEEDSLGFTFVSWLFVFGDNLFFNNFWFFFGLLVVGDSFEVIGSFGIIEGVVLV